MRSNLASWIRRWRRTSPGDGASAAVPWHVSQIPDLDTHKQRANETRLIALLEAIPDAVLRVTLNGRCIDLSRGRDHILPATAAAGQELGTILPEIKDRLAETCTAAFYTGEAQRFTYSSGTAASPRYLECRVTRSGTQEVLVTLADVTGRALAEARLASTQKLATLGMVSAGIAHEINNPLMVLAGAAQSLGIIARGTNISAQDVTEVSAKISEMVDRIGTIVRSLRQFCRDGSDDPLAVTPARAVIDSALALCRHQLETSLIQVLVDDIDEAITVRCRPVEISQILLNLIANAMDALKDAPERRITISARSRGPDVEIAVTDTGPGIPQRLRARIMEPFYTTKAAGTGLGLSLSREIARRNDGTLDLDTSSPHTRFILKLKKG